MTTPSGRKVKGEEERKKERKKGRKKEKGRPLIIVATKFCLQCPRAAYTICLDRNEKRLETIDKLPCDQINDLLKGAEPWINLYFQYFEIFPFKSVKL